MGFKKFVCVECMHKSIFIGKVFPIWQLPLRGKYQGLVTPQRLYWSKYGQKSPGQGKPLVWDMASLLLDDPQFCRMRA